ncbi:hypothetical protein M5U04_20515 [Xenorhabdus sp. XENO-1]|nr:hypothetical protein [Xenorhabdus bovienii]MCP9270390.1 hypothetical protein [Xenorhabdus bovienii subsp. africana]
MKELQKAIQKNSTNLKNQKAKEASNLLDAVRGGKPGEGWVNFTWNKSF